MEKLFLFWWHYITNPSFRRWVYMQDIEKYQNEILRMMREKQEYESKMLYNRKDY